MVQKDKSLIRLGKVVNTVGLKGELRVYPYTDYKEKFEELPYILIDNKNFPIESVRYVKSMAVIKLSGVDNIETAEQLKEKDVFIIRKDAPALPEDTYYVKDLIGLKVEDEEGKILGTLTEVTLGAAQDIYMVQLDRENRMFPIPAVSEFIRKIDLEKGTITVKLIEGLMDL